MGMAAGGRDCRHCRRSALWIPAFAGRTVGAGNGAEGVGGLGVGVGAFGEGRWGGGLGGGFEAVAYVPDGFDEGAAGGFYFGAEAAYVDVYGAGAAEVVVAPDLA